MRTGALAIGMAVLLITSKAEASEIACETAVVRGAWDLLKLSGYGQWDQEHAAFITRDTQGNHQLLHWQYQREFQRATYRGPVPPNAVAIIHTHPNSLPNPSSGDTRLAHRTGLPVYVVTRKVITRTRGHAVEVLWWGDWNPERFDHRVRSICRPGIANPEMATH